MTSTRIIVWETDGRWQAGLQRHLPQEWEILGARSETAVREKWSWEIPVVLVLVEAAGLQFLGSRLQQRSIRAVFLIDPDDQPQTRRLWLEAGGTALLSPTISERDLAELCLRTSKPTEFA